MNPPQRRQREPISEAAARAHKETRKPALDAYVARVVAAAPPMTAAQRDKLVMLLRGADRETKPRMGTQAAPAAIYLEEESA